MFLEEKKALKVPFLVVFITPFDDENSHERRGRLKHSSMPSIQYPNLFLGGFSQFLRIKKAWREVFFKG